MHIYIYTYIYIIHIIYIYICACTYYINRNHHVLTIDRRPIGPGQRVDQCIHPVQQESRGD